jgi:N4-gp56 family major capsid protein
MRPFKFFRNILAVVLLFPFVAFGANVTTTAVTTGAGFAQIPEAVRDFFSKEIIYQSQPRLKFLQFAKVKRELTTGNRGKSIAFTKYNNLSGGGTLTEGTDLEAEGMSTAEVVINVTEHGNATVVTELLLKTSLHDVLGEASKLLANNYATVLDAQFRDELLTATNTVYGAQKANATALVDGDGLTTGTIKDAIEILANNDAPKIRGEYYVCIAAPHQLRQLRDDANWIDAHKYRGTGRQLFLGEVGMYEGTIFLETTQIPTLTQAQAVVKYGAGFTATNGWEAIFMGENAYGWAISQEVELRDDGVRDYGRKHGLAWYGIWGVGIIEDLNIVKCLTA